MLASLLMMAALLADPSPQIAVDAAEHRPQHDQVWDGFYNAKINLRYHISEAARWGRWDRFCRISMLVLALIALTGPLVYDRGKKWKATWLLAGSAALIVTAVPFIWTYGEWSSEDTVLAGRWNQMANEWYALYEELPDLDAKAVGERLVVLRKQTAEVENQEKAARYEPEVMAAAERDEKQFQGIKAAPKPKPADKTVAASIGG